MSRVLNFRRKTTSKFKRQINWTNEWWRSLDSRWLSTAPKKKILTTVSKDEFYLSITFFILTHSSESSLSVVDSNVLIR